VNKQPIQDEIAKLPRFKREEIERNTVDYYRTAAGTRPDLRVVDYKDEKFIVKDFNRSDTLFRLVVGPILIRREFGALRKLIGTLGIPRLVGVVDRYALIMEHIPGTSLADIESGYLDNEFYARLREVVDRMHSRGVAHCDLRSRGNIMRGDNGQPYIVDFAACVFRGWGINPFTRWIFHQFVLADRNAVLLAKQRCSPELLTDEEKAELARPLPFERPAKSIGQNVRNLTRWLLTRKNSSRRI